MPSEIMDQRRLPFFSEELRFPTERQVGFCNPESVPDRQGTEVTSLKSGGKLVFFPMEKHQPLSPSSVEGSELSPRSLLKDQNIKFNMEHHSAEAKTITSPTMTSWRANGHEFGFRSDLSMNPATLLTEGQKFDMNGFSYENGLFSSSLSEILDRKLKLSSTIGPHGQSANTINAYFEEEEPLESLEEIESQTIGNLLPDEDDLFSGVIDDVGYIAQPNSGEDIDDDIFCSGGGMELGGDNNCINGYDLINGVSNGLRGGLNSQFVCEHPYGEHPSRSLFVRNINSSVEDSELKLLFEDNPSEKDNNQGTIVVFNLDSSVSNDDLLQKFGAYGEIKEIRETPHKCHKKFIEFYDVRAAEAALRALNRSSIAGRKIKLEASHPGGARRCSLLHQLSPELEWEESIISPSSSPPGNFGSVPHAAVTSGFDNGTVQNLHSKTRPPIRPLLDSTFHGISLSVPQNLSSPVSLTGHGENGNSFGQLKFGIQGMQVTHPHSLPEYQDGLTNGIPYNSSSAMSAAMAININSRPGEGMDNRYIHSSEGAFTAPGNGSCPVQGHPYIWNNARAYPHPSAAPSLWGNSISPSFTNSIRYHQPPQMHGLQKAPSHMLNSVLPLHPHHMGSAPVGNHSIWERRQHYIADSISTNAHNFHPSSPMHHPLELVAHNVTDVGIASPQQRCHMFQGRNHIIHMPASFDASNDRIRSRRSGSKANQGDNKKQFELDIERIIRGDESRTTLMIKNIPNKYTSKMLLAAIDEHHKGTYDFIYLPIDFKNKCNVGYAFINMIDPQQIIPFFQAFNGKKWEKFNSEKVASLAYARIQGKAALIAHFQNSSLMNEDKRCRPILFHTEGPNAGDQEPFPMGTNIRSRPGRLRTYGYEVNNQASPSTSPNGVDAKP